MSALQPLPRFRIRLHGALVRRQRRHPVEIRLRRGGQRLGDHTAVAAHGVTDAQIRSTHGVAQQVGPVPQRGIDHRNAGRRPALHLRHHRVEFRFEFTPMVDDLAQRPSEGRLRKPAPLQIMGVGGNKGDTLLITI
jgi:hypothetical protein